MDTAKVDIRKLQLLNDRINQCIDALNQVRLSVHGLSHSSQAFQGVPGTNPLGQDPRLAGLGWAGAMAANPFAGGLTHSNPLATPQPFGAGIGAVGNPYAAVNPYAAINPYAALSHTSVDPFEAMPRPMWADPLLASRISQTFPYAHAVVPPVVTIY